MPSPDVNLNNGDGKIDWVKSHEVFQWWVQEMERESEQTLEDQAVAIVNEVPQTDVSKPEEEQQIQEKIQDDEDLVARCRAEVRKILETLEPEQEYDASEEYDTSDNEEEVQVADKTADVPESKEDEKMEDDAVEAAEETTEPEIETKGEEKESS